MPTKHTVVQGETVLSIAKAHGFRDWRVVWDDPANADLKSKRANGGVLNPGDELTLPDREKKELDVKVDATYRFKVKSTQAFYSTLLKDAYGEPYQSTRYRLVVDGKTIEGKTDDKGYLLESVPPDAQEAQVTVLVTVRGSAGRTRTAEVAYPKVRLGRLDPIDTDTGVQGRLAALGYRCPIDGDLTGDGAREAVRAFQGDHALGVTGDVDPTTRSAIRDAYDNR
ncbi:MAG: peptidoglycan-binding protein [Planctomycetes bacterium]|nr:peptidoglycan-binding protein [Planctomycetota bacterium]